MELTDVLRGGRQCDEDGVEIIMSRQACVEAADELDHLRAENASLKAENENLYTRYNKLVEELIHVKESVSNLTQQLSAALDQIAVMEAALQTCRYTASLAGRTYYFDVDKVSTALPKPIPKGRLG